MIRELTPDEQARLLTQEQVDQLPNATHIMVKWAGGNGPHEYITESYEGAIYTVLPDRKGEMFTILPARPWPHHIGKLEYVGTERCHDRVFLLIKNSE